MGARRGIILLSLLLAACARFAGTGGAPQVEGAWVLVEGRGPAGEINVPPGHRITLNFENDEVGGQACNHYGGSYELGGDGRLSLGAMSMTEMACAEPMMTVEAAYHAALSAVSQATRDGDRLTLLGDETELVFELLPPVPDAALEGTRWELESLIDGESASSVQGEPFLELNPDGSLTGSTGCRAVSGRYVVSGDRLMMTELGADGECGPELEAQDRHIIGVLEAGFSVELEADRLTLGLPDGTGLDYRAAGG